MLDPAIVLGLQQALSPPPRVEPPAIYSEWTSEAASGAEQILEPWMCDQEAQGSSWRQATRDYAAQLDGMRDAAWSEAELGELDEIIADGARRADSIRDWASEIQKQAARTQRTLRRMDFSSARVHRRYADRFARLQSDNVAAMRSLLSAIERYRAWVDGRTGAAPGFVHAPWAPNGNTVAAMQDARSGSGLRRVTSIADLMGALDAEGD